MGERLQEILANQSAQEQDVGNATAAANKTVASARDSIVLQEDIAKIAQEDASVNMDEYMLIADVEERIQSAVEEKLEESKMQQALMIDTVESKHTQKYNS